MFSGTNLRILCTPWTRCLDFHICTKKKLRLSRLRGNILIMRLNFVVTDTVKIVGNLQEVMRQARSKLVQLFWAESISVRWYYLVPRETIERDPLHEQNAKAAIVSATSISMTSQWVLFISLVMLRKAQKSRSFLDKKFTECQWKRYRLQLQWLHNSSFQQASWTAIGSATSTGPSISNWMRTISTVIKIW